MHIEPTSRCILSCPGCPRTRFSQKFHRPFPKQDLDLDCLDRFLDCESGHQIDSFLLNGNHGDPIYYPDLINLIQRFRNRKFKISTNGSRMPEKFWHTLSENLTANDTIYFSIDGLEHDNHLYRRNSDWASIMQGLGIMVKGPARVVWKSIIFSYNQHELAEMEQMAQNLGAEFFSETTGYFGDESLRPSDIKLVRSDLLYQNTWKSEEVDPKCDSGRTEFVSADGYYWPCCMISNYQVLHKTLLWKQKDEWNINTQNLDQMRIKVGVWSKLVKDQGLSAPSICKMLCSPNTPDYQWSKS